MKYDGSERDVIIMLPFFIHSAAFAKVITSFASVCVTFSVLQGWKITPACQLRALAIHFCCNHLSREREREWWMNVDVIKQFSVCLKVCNFNPCACCLAYMKIKIIFPFFFSHPPFFAAKDNCQGCRENSPPVASVLGECCCFWQHWEKFFLAKIKCEGGWWMSQTYFPIKGWKCA